MECKTNIDYLNVLKINVNKKNIVDGMPYIYDSEKRQIRFEVFTNKIYDYDFPDTPSLAVSKERLESYVRHILSLISSRYKLTMAATINEEDDEYLHMINLSKIFKRKKTAYPLLGHEIVCAVYNELDRAIACEKHNIQKHTH